jgi:predicted nucleic acid-binding protein
MIVLDTNVLSEMMRPAPSPVVMQWLASQPAEHLMTTALTVAEIEHGMDLLIAAVVRARGLVLATRNEADVHACGFEVVNPWS